MVSQCFFRVMKIPGENPRNSEKPMKFQKITFTAFSWYIYQRNYFHGMLNWHENMFLFHFKTF